MEQKVRDLEVSTEADKIAKKIAIDAEVMKVDQKRNEQLEKRIKELQEHEDYVKQVLATQEMKKKNYLASLERSLDKATKRKEDHLAKVVEFGLVEDLKVAEAKEKRELSEKEMQAKTLAALTVKLSKVEEVRGVEFIGGGIFHLLEIKALINIKNFVISVIFFLIEESNLSLAQFP